MSPPAAKDSQGIGRQGFVGLGGLRLAFGAANRLRSITRGRISAPPSGGLGAPQAAKQDRAGNGSAHPLRSTHPPTRVREWVSYEADPMIVLDGCTGGRVGSGVGAVPRVAESGRWGLWVAARSAAAHSRDLVCCVNRVEVIPSQ